MLELARSAADRPAELLALRHRVLARMECGKIHEVESDIRAFARIADELRQPVYGWYVFLWRGYLAHMRGELDEVETCIDHVERIGALVGSRNSVMLALTQRFWVLAERLDEEGMRALLRPLVESVDDQVPTSQVVLQLFPGMPREGHRAAFPLLPQLLDDLPVDAEWLNFLAVFATTLFEDEAPAEYAAMVYDRLLPHRARFVVDGMRARRGSVEHYLGMLASLTDDVDASESHFARALVANGGAPMHVATTLRARGIAGRRRGDERGVVDLAAARDAYRQMGLTARTAETESMLGPLSRLASPNIFVREGAAWRLTYAGRTTVVKHSKGMADIASLLSQPHHEVHVLDITGGPVVPRRRNLGPVLDAKAKAAYRRRLADLQEAADEGDETAAAEREALVAQLASAYGMGGRARTTGATTERARSAVTLRIRNAIARIEVEHSGLGRHLRVAVRTGTFCAYEPEPEVTWLLGPGLTS